MPLPIKQYKYMFKDVKFLATTAQPNYREVSHWIDLLEDPTGGTIKVWNGAEWKKISGEGDSDTGLVIGDTTGTAFDGARGKAVEDKVKGLRGYYVGRKNSDRAMYNSSTKDHISLNYYVFDFNNPNLPLQNRSVGFDSATTTKAGVMSANDKKNLDNVAGLYYIPYSGSQKEWAQKIKDAAGNNLGAYIDCATDGSSLGFAFKNDNVYKCKAGGIRTASESEIDIYAYYMPNLDNSDEFYYANILLKTGGDGSKFLSDDGTYKQIDIPDISSIATKDELSTKRDVLVSGTNIKTVNGNSLLGEGNIEIQGGGEGIADAPSDGKKYVRQNANWVEETTVDTSTFATTAQLANKVDTSTYTEDKATFATKAELANKANTSDLSNYLTTTDAESNYAKKSEIPSLEGYLQTSTADEKYATKTELNGKADTSALASKQDTLVSGTNIKTINNQSLLGNGNIDIAAGDSKVYVFEMNKYITETNNSQRFTGTIADEDYTTLMGAITNNKLILGKITDDDSIPGYIPLQTFVIVDGLYLKGEFVLGPICLEISYPSKTYQGYFYSETIVSNNSSTVTVNPLPDELIYIDSGRSTLTNVSVDSIYNFRLLVTTEDQSVTLKVNGLTGVIGATINEGNITLEANSRYEIDVTDYVAVVAKMNLVDGPQ